MLDEVKLGGRGPRWGLTRRSGSGALRAARQLPCVVGLAVPHQVVEALDVRLYEDVRTHIVNAARAA